MDLLINSVWGLSDCAASGFEVVHFVCLPSQYSTHWKTLGKVIKEQEKKDKKETETSTRTLGEATYSDARSGAWEDAKGY